MITLFPAPPDEIVRFDTWMVAHGLIPLYWIITIVKFAAWGLLLRQRRPNETPPARSLRWMLLAAAIVWLALLTGRYIQPGWRIFDFVVVSIFAGAMAVWFIVSCLLTYGFGRGAPPLPPVNEGDPEAYAGVERRIRERRRNWRPPRVGA